MAGLSLLAISLAFFMAASMISLAFSLAMSIITWVRRGWEEHSIYVNIKIPKLH